MFTKKAKKEYKGENKRKVSPTKKQTAKQALIARLSGKKSKK